MKEVSGEERHSSKCADLMESPEHPLLLRLSMTLVPIPENVAGPFSQAQVLLAKKI